MEAKRHRRLLAGLLLTETVALLSCSEDNPDECYSNADCPPASNAKATICIKTYYNSGIPSGGYCAECVDDSNCTDPALPTCDAYFYTCVRESVSGISGLDGGGIPDREITDSGGAGSGGEDPSDDAGRVDDAASESDDAEK